MRRAAAIPLVVAALLLPVESRAQDLPESSPEALQHHALGVADYLKGSYTSAIDHFTKAYASDPTSYLSLLMAGISAGNAGQGAKADSFYALVVPHKSRLSQYYQYRLESQMAGRAGNAAAVREANEKAMALGPGTKASYNLALTASNQGRFAEARNLLRSLDPDKEPMRGWYGYYSVLATSSHGLGDYEEELRIARKARAAFPGDMRALSIEADALIALGRIAEAEKVMAEIQTMPSSALTGTAGSFMTTLAQELNAHGNAAASRKWMQTALKWYGALPADSARTENNRGDKAYLLYSMGDFRSAAAIYHSLSTQYPATAVYKAWNGYLAARLGDPKKAADIAQQLENGTIKMTPGNSAIWRGLIAIGMKDRDRGVALIRQSGARAGWMHRDPIVSRDVAGIAAWQDHLKPIA